MKKKMKVGLVAIVAIAAIMMLSSYAGAADPDEIMELMPKNSTEVKTYKYDMNMTINVLTGNETNVTEKTIKINGCGERDYVNESLWMAMDINVNLSEDMGEDANMGAGVFPSLDMPEAIDMEMYLINNITYMKVDLGIPFMPTLWIKMKPPVVDETYNESYNETYLSFQDQLELLMALLNSSNVTLKAEATLDMTTTSQDTGEEATIAIDFTMRLYDYNVPVTIKLPAEAGDAIDIGDLFGMLPE